MINFASTGNQASWSIDNNSGTEARIANIGFAWPGDNAPQEVSLADGVWLNESEMATMLQEANPSIGEDPRATIPDGNIRTISIKHLFGPLHTEPYELQLAFDLAGGVCLLTTDY